MKKIRKTLLLTLAFMLAFSPVAFAEPGDAKTAVGADLSDSQKNTVYAMFGIDRGIVEEITVTIDEEKAFLGSKVPADKIGKRSLSSVYVMEMDPGYGITVETHNINWVTAEMYIAALTTAGIENAMIVVASPVEVSGTAALTGLFKAYESITGSSLDDAAKNIAGDELIFTGQLAELLGSEEAVEYMNQLKLALAESENMTDDEIRQIILEYSIEYNVELTSTQIDQLIVLARNLAKMDLTPEKLLSMAEQFEKTWNTINKVQEKTSGFVQSVTEFFNKVGDWFSNLFSKK